MNKQKLQEQIDTMRAELAKMETELAECEKIGLKEGKFHLNGDGTIGKGNAPYYQKNGATRATKELAEIASKNMVTRNKLEAYVHQIDPEWRDSGGMAWMIYLDNDGKYGHLYNRGYRNIGTVYMSESTAEQICEWLNDGRIEL